MNTNSKFKTQNSKLRGAFTLIELLTVIAVIAIIAALLFPAFNAVKNRSTINAVTGQMHQLEASIDSYKATRGYYPPGNAAANGANLGPALTNQLYYELGGTTADPAGTDFTNLDGSGYLPTGTISTTFGVGGFMNCTKGTGEDAATAKNFLPGLKPGQIATNSAGVFVIITSINSGVGYQPMPGFNSRDGINSANPWRYLYPGVNNPTTYDLWIQIIVAGKTNLICNWKDTPSINSSQP
jgi:prepilin-type N-terminal cleavage/methylation domain-containing protein